MGKKIEYDFLINNKQAISSIKKINSELDKTEKKLKGLKSGPVGGGKSRGVGGPGMKGGGFNFSSMVVPTAAIASIGAMGIQSIQTAAKVQALDNAIKFAGGAEGQFNLKFLNDTVNSLGLESVSAKEGFKIWTSAIKSTALEGNKGRKIFESFAKSTKRLGLSADDTKGVFLALGQMVSKGKVSMEELRQQLGERMPGAFQAAARAMGVTTAELDKLVSTGKVTAEELLPKMAIEMEKTFGGKMEKNISGSMNRISNVWTSSMASMGNALAPLAEATANFLEMMNNSSTDQIIKNTQKEFVDLGVSVDRIIERMEKGNITVEEQNALLSFLAKKYGSLAPILNALSDKEKQRLIQLEKVSKAAKIGNDLQQEKLALLDKEAKKQELIEKNEKSAQASNAKNIRDEKRKTGEKITRSEAQRAKVSVGDFVKTSSEISKLEKEIESVNDKILKGDSEIHKLVGVGTPKSDSTGAADPSDLLKNEVRGVSGQVKNINVTVDAVNKIAGDQVINGAKDAQEGSVWFEEMMATVVADISQK